LQGHPAPSREKGKEVAGTIAARFGSSRNNHEECVTWPAEISSTLDTTFGTKIGLENQHVNAGCPMFVPAQPIPLNTMNCFRSPNADASTGCGIGEEGEAMFTISKTNSHAVAQPVYEMHGQDSRVRELKDVCTTVSATYGTAYTIDTWATQGVAQAMAVRRLTPVECERLQGFPDKYTDIQPKGKATPDGPRYKALGNSMAVPVMAWIGKRIQEVDAICKTQQKQ
jgi:DNA (cytosine-5)-methyltransferase 1